MKRSAIELPRTLRSLFRSATQSSWTGILLPAVAVVSISGGCAGGTLQRFTGEDEEISRELPEEFRNRFEIKEVKGASPTPAPAASPQAAPSSAPAAAVVPSTAASPTPTPKPVPSTAVGAAPSFLPRNPVSPVVSKTSARRLKLAYPDRRPKQDPIWLGEKHTFRISYLGVKVGECSTEVMPFKEVNGRKAYHVKGHAFSVNPFRLFYRIDNDIETLFDYRSIVSHRFRLLLDESKQTRDALELNDHEQGQEFYWNRLNLVGKGYSEKKVVSEIPPLTQDTLSQLFFLRTIPLKDGETFEFPLATEGKVAETTVTVMGREEIDTIFGRVRAVKIRPIVRFHGILKPAGDSYIWMSDDDRRIVLRIEARVKIGAVYADIVSFDRGLPPGPGQGRDDEPVAAAEKVAMPAVPVKPRASGALKPASDSGTSRDRGAKRREEPSETFQ